MGINITPFAGDRNYFTNQLKSSAYVLRCVIVDLEPTTVTSGTTDYTGTKNQQLGTTTDFNGTLFPESYYGQFSDYSNITRGNSGYNGVQTINTGAVNAVLRKRYFLDYKLPAGVTVSRCTIKNFDSVISDVDATYIGGIANTGTTISGLTGTLSVQLNFGVIESDNTKTQLGTSTQSLTLSDTPQQESLYVSATNATATSDSDRLYVEVVYTLNQTARTAGTAPVAARNAVGYITPPQPYLETLVEFEIT